MKKFNSNKNIKLFFNFSVIFASTLFLFSCNSEQKRQIAIQNAKNEAIKNYVAQLSPAEKISQVFLVNIQGDETFVPIEKAELLGEFATDEYLVPGGILLFKYNIGKTKEQVQTFTNSIQDFYKKNNKVPPYIAIDQEGGYVNRLRKITSDFPSQKKIADTFTVEQARQLYKIQSQEMAALGINMNLAPVVEVETPENADFLDTRSFGDIQKVLTYGKIEIEEFEQNKVATVLKHFPGNSNVDPHSGLPEIKITKQKLQEELIQPFEKLLPLSSAVLMSHAKILVTDEDFPENSKLPSCLSNYWGQKIIREQLNFDGLILSDDIFMAALNKNRFPPEIACVKAFEAGVDILMLSEKRFGDVAKLLLQTANESQEFNQQLEQAICRVIKYKIKAGLLEYRQIEENSKIPQFIIQNKK